MNRVSDRAATKRTETEETSGVEVAEGRSRRRVLAALLFISLLAAALRWPLAHEPLWVDELHTSWVVGQGSAQLPANARAGNQSPLWFYLPWLATRVSSASDAATNLWLLRLPSLLAGLAIPWLVYVVARRLTGQATPALFAAALAALDPRFAFYATEARAYATVQLLTLIHFLCWMAARGLIGPITSATNASVDAPTRFWASKNFWRIAWIATGGLLFFTHYTTALVFVAEALADFGILATAAIRKRQDRGNSTQPPQSFFASLSGLLVEFVLLLAVCLPAIPHLNTVASHRSDWSRTLSADDPWTMFDWYGMAIAPLAVVAVTAIQRSCSKQWPWLRPLKLAAAWRLGVWILVPWLVAWTATAFEVAQLLRYRYLIASATMLPFVAALSLSALPRRAAQMVMVAIVLTVVIARHEMLRPWWETGQWPAQRDERWPELVERVGGLLATKRVPVLLFPALVEDYRLKVVEEDSGGTAAEREARERLVRFCRFPLDAYASRLPAETAVLPLSTLASPRLDTATLGQLAQRGGGLIVIRGDDQLAAYLMRQLTAELARNGIRLTAASPESYGNLQLIAFTARR
ncbi:MAG: hypothetical protein ACKO38_20320 [Planctomycetota bacterium]